jgi:hypothetical protein
MTLFPPLIDASRMPFVIVLSPNHGYCLCTSVLHFDRAVSFGTGWLFSADDPRSFALHNRERDEAAYKRPQ